MGAIEIFAWIFAVAVLIKLSVVLVNPKLWLSKVAEPALKNVKVLKMVYLVLTLVVGYFLFQSMTVVQVSAVFLFVSGILGLSMLPYHKHLLKAAKDIKKNGIKDAWLPIVLFLALALWTVYALVF